MDTQVFTKAGLVEFADGTTSTFGAATIQCDSEAMCEYGYIGVNKGNEGGTNVVTSWHEHNEEPIEDLPATCTTEGFSGRTYCDECGSVVDWGTTISATGHTYDFVEGEGYGTKHGPFDELRGRRATFACFPWRFKKGEGSSLRCLAFTDPEQEFRFETGEPV